MCAVVAGVRGVSIAPEGDLTKAITFDGAVGVYLITLAFVLPLAQFPAAGERRWVSCTVGLVVYAFGIETIQTLRGLDPRFSRIGAPADRIAAFVFLLAALGIIVTFAILALKLVRRGTGGPAGLMLLALRYAIHDDPDGVRGGRVHDRRSRAQDGRGRQHTALARDWLSCAPGGSARGVVVKPLKKPRYCCALLAVYSRDSLACSVADGGWAAGDGTIARDHRGRCGAARLGAERRPRPRRVAGIVCACAATSGRLRSVPGSTRSDRWSP